MKKRKETWSVEQMLRKTDLSSEECRCFLSQIREVEWVVSALAEKLIADEVTPLYDRLKTIQSLLEQLRDGPSIRAGIVCGTISGATAISMLREGYKLAVSDFRRALGGDFKGMQSSLKPRIFDAPWREFTADHLGEA